jgi:hypothetical protein
MDQSIIPSTPAAQLATQATGTKRVISDEEREKRRLRMANARAAKRAAQSTAVPVATPAEQPSEQQKTPAVQAEVAQRIVVVSSERVEFPTSGQRVHVSQGIAVPAPVRLIRPE